MLCIHTYIHTDTQRHTRTQWCYCNTSLSTDFIPVTGVTGLPSLMVVVLLPPLLRPLQLLATTSTSGRV